MPAVPLHCPSVNSLGNALGLPEMNSLGDAPELTGSMSCQAFPMWQKLLLRHSLGQPRWSMGPGLQVLGTPKTRETPCVVLRERRTTMDHEGEKLIMPGEDLALLPHLPRAKTSLKTSAKTSTWRRLREGTCLALTQ